MTMRVLTCAILFLLFCQSSLGSRITFQATPRNISPVLTKTLQLRCAIQQNGRIIKRQIDSSLLPQSTWSAKQASSPIGTTTTATAKTTVTSVHVPTTLTSVHVPTTLTSVHVPTAVTSVNSPTTLASVHVPTTDFPKEASHVISIIVSRKDKATGLLEKVASLSSFDPPIAYTDFDKITVNGHSDSSPIPGELGYLEITWTYPAGYQSGSYTCEIYALDVTLHPVSLSEVVQITASEPTNQELASIILQNNKYITELSQTVSELKNQTLHLQSQIQENALALNNITEHRNETKAQNIQTGPVFCYYSRRVTFDRPYNSIPTVLLAFSGLAAQTYSGNVTITLQYLSETGFNPVCSYSSITPTAYWIAIGN